MSPPSRPAKRIPFPNEPGAVRFDWQAQLQLGCLELDQHHLHEALRRFDRACVLNRDAGIAWFYYGLTSFRMGMFADAVEALERAEYCGFKTALCAQTRGDASYNLEQYEGALLAYQTALQREPNSPALRARLGLALVRSGYPEKGLAKLKSDLLASPAAPELYEGLILTYVLLDRPREAADAAQERLSAIPDAYPGDYLRAAALYQEIREYTRALTILQQGLQAHPKNHDLERAINEARLHPSLTLQNS